jgi:hypothetical protein
VAHLDVRELTNVCHCCTRRRCDTCTKEFIHHPGHLLEKPDLVYCSKKCARNERQLKKRKRS